MPICKQRRAAECIGSARQRQGRIARFALPAALFWSMFTARLSAATVAGCMPVVFEGEVRAGHAWQQPINSALDFKLEAVPAGWIIRVLPRGANGNAGRSTLDFAELANPPYRSPTPILISTDFAFRAQDAIAWNPRTFHFFTTAAQRTAADAAYQANLRDPTRPDAAQALFRVLPQAAEGEFRILDAEIAGGTANQTAAAGAVASHFAQTAHRVRADLPPTSLGQILSLRFRVSVPSQDTLPCTRKSSPQHQTHP